MPWNVEHNFPALKDTYEVPTDYPNVGYDTIIASWFTDVFTSIFAIEDALGYDVRDGFDDLAARLSGKIYHTRIVGGTPDFDGNDFTTDGNEHFLDLSGIIPVGTKAVMLNGWILWDVPALRVIYPVNAGADWSDYFTFTDTPADCSFIIVLPVDATRKIAYIFDDDIWLAESSLSVVGWFK